MSGSLVGYDFVISMACSSEDYRVIVPQVQQVFKKWCFQGEQGDTGYKHWQGRGWLWKKRPRTEVCREFGPMLWNAEFLITSSEVHLKNNFNYVMKADGRISGPFRDTDAAFEPPPVLTRQLKTFIDVIGELGTGMYPWQFHLLQLIEHPNDRLITCIVDESAGNNGKSIMSEYLEYLGIAFEIPPMMCMEDIMQCCMGIKQQKCYVVDMPRAMKKEKLAGFFAGCEALKNGTMYDKRYCFKKRRIDRPCLVVFTNSDPDRSLLSPDKWDVWYMRNRTLFRTRVDLSAV